jgi:glutamyl-tRNA synthetase
MLGWNSGTEQELFSMEELIAQFSIERVHKSGAKFDYEKAKWFNHEWIKKSSTEALYPLVKKLFEIKNVATKNDNYFKTVIGLVKERCTLISDFYEQSVYFFEAPQTLDVDAVKPKWNENKQSFFEILCTQLTELKTWDVIEIENCFKNLATEKTIKPGELQLPMRIMLVGGKFGPAVFEIANLIGKEETLNRIQSALTKINS